MQRNIASAGGQLNTMAAGKPSAALHGGRARWFFVKLLYLFYL